MLSDVVGWCLVVLWVVIAQAAMEQGCNSSPSEPAQVLRTARSDVGNATVPAGSKLRKALERFEHSAECQVSRCRHELESFDRQFPYLNYERTIEKSDLALRYARSSPLTGTWEWLRFVLAGPYALWLVGLACLLLGTHRLEMLQRLQALHDELKRQQVEPPMSSARRQLLDRCLDVDPRILNAGLILISLQWLLYTLFRLVKLDVEQLSMTLIPAAALGVLTFLLYSSSRFANKSDSRKQQIRKALSVLGLALAVANLFWNKGDVLGALALGIALWNPFWSLTEAISKLRKEPPAPLELSETTRRGVEAFARVTAIILAGLFCYLLILMEVRMMRQSTEIGVGEVFDLGMHGLFGLVTVMWILESIAALAKLAKAAP